MASLRERNAMPKIGPRFFRADDGELMFEFVIDHGNVIGPRPAVKADSEKHPAAWSEFVAPRPEPEPTAELPARTAVEIKPEMEAAFDRLEGDRPEAAPVEFQKYDGYAELTIAEEPATPDDLAPVPRQKRATKRKAA